MANKHEGLGDDQGARIGAPDSQRGASPAPHNDGPTGRPERSTGAGQEATLAGKESEEHESGYGGQAGAPKQSSDEG